MVPLVNSHTNATRIGWHLWEIDLRFAPGLPAGWGPERDLDFDHLLVRIHCIIVIIRWTGLAPFPFQVAFHLPS